MISNAMIGQICSWETGHDFGYAMPDKDLNGYDLGDAGGHRTFGYGLLFHPTANTYMDNIKSNWSQQELEQLYIQTLQKKSTKVENWASGLNLNQSQIDAIVSGCYNFGDGFLNKNVCKMIKENPSNPEIRNVWAHLSDSQGKKYPGLIKRRAIEANWFFGEIDPSKAVSGSFDIGTIDCNFIYNVPRKEQKDNKLFEELSSIKLHLLKEILEFSDIAFDESHSSIKNISDLLIKDKYNINVLNTSNINWNINKKEVGFINKNKTLLNIKSYSLEPKENEIIKYNNEMAKPEDKCNASLSEGIANKIKDLGLANALIGDR